MIDAIKSSSGSGVVVVIISLRCLGDQVAAIELALVCHLKGSSWAGSSLVTSIFYLFLGHLMFKAELKRLDNL